MKIECTACSKSKPIEQFSWKNKKLNKRSGTCKDCHKLYCSNHYQNNKDQYRDKNRLYRKEVKGFIDKYKSENPCSCGESDIVCLEFHHKDSKKKDFNIANATQRGLSLEKIKLEIEKCIVICSNCHRKLHAQLRLNIPD